MGIELKSHGISDSVGSAALLATLRGKITGRLALGLSLRVDRYGLKRDLNVPVERPSAKIPISVRSARAVDLDRLLSPAMPLDPVERRELHARRSFAEKVGGGAYVAIDERTGVPCYVQWLLGPSQNPVIASLGGFPALSEGEALLEDAYTPPSHRGLGIMSAAMALIAEHGADIGARHVITFVGVDNIASLKGCKRAGFDPYLVHMQTNFLFGMIRRDRFEPLAEHDPRRQWKF